MMITTPDLGLFHGPRRPATSGPARPATRNPFAALRVAARAAVIAVTIGLSAFAGMRVGATRAPEAGHGANERGTAGHRLATR